MADRLGPYRAKRDFDATPEPAPAEPPGGGEQRYVVQEHHARALHWDLRLATWLRRGREVALGAVGIQVVTHPNVGIRAPKLGFRVSGYLARPYGCQSHRA